MASNSRELAQRATVDPDDEPSAEWGWHGTFPKGMLIAGWVAVVIMLVMLIGNHQGRIEDIFLIVTAIIMAGGLILHSVRQRNSWRR